MCDYSLHLYPNRLAIDGEELVTYRFGNHVIGLASPKDIPLITATTKASRATRWERFKAWFERNLKRQRTWEVAKQVCAVCIPPGARLLLHDIHKNIQQDLGVSSVEEVTFTERTAEPNTYHDGIRFQNGKELLLQSLRAGQRVIVLNCAPQEQEVFQGFLNHEELLEASPYR